jgi:hypothetical protein
VVEGLRLIGGVRRFFHLFEMLFPRVLKVFRDDGFRRCGFCRVQRFRREFEVLFGHGRL